MNCQECIVSDMVVGCALDGDDGRCKVFNRRLRALLDGNPSLVAARAALLEIQQRHERDAIEGDHTECGCADCELIQVTLDKIGHRPPMSEIGAGIFEALKDGMKQAVPK